MLDERQTQHVTLGCGTFILIALIVMFFSDHGNSKLDQDVQSLRSDVIQLKKAVDLQTEEIKKLTEKTSSPRAEKNPSGP